MEKEQNVAWATQNTYESLSPFQKYRVDEIIEGYAALVQESELSVEILRDAFSVMALSDQDSLNHFHGVYARKNKQQKFSSVA